tara:strand:+ start:128 stop:511 length:384 start_codon:yes stop_codon:yes gene_type:complete
MKKETHGNQKVTTNQKESTILLGTTHSSQGEYNMKDIIGNTVEVYKERIENSNKHIAILNKILNGELEKIFDPSKAYQGDLFTKKGKLKVKFIKDLAWYRKHIKSEYKNISHNEKMIEMGNFIYNNK